MVLQARIPYLGLRVPLKCFRSWRYLAKRNKFQRHRTALDGSAMAMRPRAIRLQQRVSVLLANIEAEAEVRKLNGRAMNLVICLTRSHTHNSRADA